jgi:hypothetical protein
VQPFPSSHPLVFGRFSQPPAAEHRSSVQALLSLQSTMVPPSHAPPEQASLPVHRFPSLQAAKLFVYAQPLAGTQASSVHALVSLQTTSMLTQRCVVLEHISSSHMFASVHCGVVVQQPAIIAFTQLFDAQVSVVHSSLSSQSPALLQQSAMAALVQMPVAVLQVSLVQALPSLQSAAFEQQAGIGVCVHSFDTELQTSVVQALMSAHSALPVQQSVIAENMQVCMTGSHAFVVHAFMSSHSVSRLQQLMLSMFEHSPFASQTSSVHGFRSSQLAALVHAPVSVGSASGKVIVASGLIPPSMVASRLVVASRLLASTLCGLEKHRPPEQDQPSGHS